MSHMSVVHHHPMNVAITKEAWASETFIEERQGNFARNVTVVTLVSAVAFLAAISAWLWYGAHLYQNCL